MYEEMPCTSASITQKYAPQDFQGVLLVNGCQGPADSLTPLSNDCVVAFVPTLPLTLIAVSGNQVPFIVHAYQPVSEIRRLCSGQMTPGDTFYCGNRLLNEAASFALQGVEPNTQIKVLSEIPVRSPVSLHGLLQAFNLPYNRFDSAGNRSYTAPATPTSYLTRGGQVYYPPSGWQRFGLKVQKGVWLGKTNAPG